MDTNRYIVKNVSLGDKDSAYAICGAGTEQEYNDSKVSDWFNNGTVTVLSDDGYDVLVRFDAQYDIDTLLSRCGFVFDNDRIHVHRA